jgi:iron complex outermembrane receptor protein
MKMNTLLFSICLIFAVTLQTIAQKNTTDSLLTVELEEVEISAFRAKTSVLNAPVSLSVAQISANWSGPSRSLQEYLTNIPGVLTLNSSNYAQDLRISMRGFGSRAAFGIRGIKLVVDGIPETTPDGQGQLDNLPLSLIREISVIRGPSALRYGNASGGVIAINTLSSGVEGANSVSLLTGGFGQRQISTTQGFGTENNSCLLHYTHQKIEGFREHSNVENNIFNFRSSHRLSYKTRLNLQLNHVSSPIAQDPGGLNLEDFQSDPFSARGLNVTYNAGERLTHSKAGVSVVSEISAKLVLSAYGFYSGRDFNAFLPFENGGIVDLNRIYVGQGSSITYDAGDWNFQLGYDWASQNDHRQRYQNIQGVIGEQTLNQNEIFKGLGGYLISQWQKNNWIFNGGIRYDNNLLSVEDQFLSNGDNSDQMNLHALSPQIGFSYRINDFSLFGGYSSGYETPTLSELSATLDGEGGFNKNLDIQQARQIEVGLRYQSEKLQGSIVGYSISTENDILPYESASFPSQTLYQNIGETRRTGIELEANYQPIPSISIRANYNYATNTFENVNYDGMQLPGIARDFGQVSFSHQITDEITLSLQRFYRGELFANNDNTVTIPKINVDHLELIWKAKRVTLSGGIQNLFNKTYSDNIRINAFGGRFYETALPRQVYTRVSVYW